ncbi:MAG: hypothetical protein HY871_03140, partial [Chloroflexi bacterium]|nr:hypothetical protein [Chloroflexota bacterium]
MRCRHRAIEFVAPLGLLALTLVFFWKLLFTNLIYPGYDAFTYFYPYQAYAAEALRDLRLPLWNPRIFTGVPFLANLQAGLLYLPNWPLFLSTSVPKAYAYSVALHVFLAGCSTYLLARLGLGLGRYGALSAGLVFMFGGFLAGQVGHINQLNAAAWLPLLLLLVHLACCTRRWRYVVLAGVFLALQFLAGHAQESFMTMVILGRYALWKAIGQITLSSADEVPGSGAGLRRRWAKLSGGLLILAAVIVIGVGLAAVQLVPSAELAAQSVRSGGVTYRQAVSFSLDPRKILVYLLPNFAENPFYEYLGYVGVLGLLLALYGVAKRGKEPWVRFNLLLALGALVLAFGGYTPLYRLLYYLVPGFGLFRVPARWLMVYSLAMALLAGVGMDSLSRGREVGRFLSAKELAFKAAGWWRGLGTGWRVALLAVGFIALALTPFLKYPPLPVLGLWLGTLGLAVVIFCLGVRSHRWSAILLVMSGALFGELFLASRNLELNLPVPPEAYAAWRPSGSFLRTDTGIYRVLSLSDALFDPGDLPEINRIFSSQLSGQQVASYVTALKNKEIIAPNLGMLLGLDSVDGYDGGLLPLKRYVQMEPFFLPAGQSAADGRLRERMSAFPSEKVLSLFNVKYLLADKVHDVWVEDVYYDLGNQVALGQGDSYAVTTEGLPRFPVTSLGVISYLAGAEAIPDQAVVAEIEVTDAAGSSHKYQLRAGIDTAQGEYGTANLGGVAHPMARIAKDVAAYQASSQLSSTFEIVATATKGHTP